jgi:hypothetical protein
MNKYASYTALAFLVSLLIPAMAFANDGTADVDSTAFYAAVIGSLVPALAYLLNHYAPWVSEPVKAVVFAVVGAGAGVVTQLLDDGDFALDTPHLKVVGISMLFAFLAHMGFWKPSTLSTKLGGGSNARGNRHHH